MAYFSDFPNQIDSFEFKTEILASDIPAIHRFQELKLKPNRTPAEEQELGNLTNQLRSKLMSADEWNKFADALVNMEVFIRDQVVVTIDQRRDAALQAIDQKTNNVIQYLDGTTAGQLRNDIGIMGDLTTTAKDSLVNAVNEVNGKIVDASVTKKGIVQLSNATNGTRENVAPTEKALKTVYDLAAFTGGYGVTTNSGNAYSVKPNPAPTVLVEGLRITVKINVANTGAATINVNGLGAKSILKSNGTGLTSGNLKVNSVYSLVYNGTAFILQGEGGGGTAGPGDVRSTKTATNDNGEFTGTLVTRATGPTTVIPTLVDQVLQAGIYDGAITVKPGRKFAKGSEFTDSNGLLSVPSGLGFRPKNLIVIRQLGLHTGVYTEDLPDSPYNYYYDQWDGYRLTKDQFTILNDGFTLKTDDLGTRFYYYATN